MYESTNHVNILKNLSNEGLINVAQESVMSFISNIQNYSYQENIPHFGLLPIEVEDAVSSLLVLTRCLSKSDSIFNYAVKNSQMAWGRLEKSIDSVQNFLNSENIILALSYINHLVKFRLLWSLLFGPSYPRTSPCEVPPHMFAVCWSEVRSTENIEWIHLVEKNTKKIFFSIQSKKSTNFSYFLFILQYMLTVRVKLLECISEIFENSMVCVDIMLVVRYMYIAQDLLKKYKNINEVWKNMGLFSNYKSKINPKFKTYFDISDFCSIDSSVSNSIKLHEEFSTDCAFLWILKRLLWCLYGRLSLLFSSCLVLPLFDTSYNKLTPTLIGEGEEVSDEIDSNIECNNTSVRKLTARSDIKIFPSSTSVTDMETLSRRKSITLPHVLSRDILPSGYERRSQGNFMMMMMPTSTNTKISSSSSSFSSPPPLLLSPPFYLNFSVEAEALKEWAALEACGCHLLAESLWAATHETRGATLLVMTDCTQRPGRRVWVNNKYKLLPVSEDTGRHGMEHWVLNFIFPHARLSNEATSRASQESLLLRTIVFRVAGVNRRRLRFINGGTVFYVLRSDREVDGGRLYFVLLLTHDSNNNNNNNNNEDDDGSILDDNDYDSDNKKKKNNSIEAKVYNDSLRKGQTRTQKSAESRWAFRSLEDICAVWGMPQLCNAAVQLAAFGT